MIEDLRTSDIEEGERERSIRTYLGQRHDGGIELFGIVPSLSWDQIQEDEDVDTLLEKVEIEATGITHPPVPSNFHPSEAEVTLDLDPTADSYELQISGPDVLGSITGTWTTSGLQHGDLFVGDETRAQRYNSDHQVRKDMWVYLVSKNPPKSEVSFVDVYDFAPKSLVGFRASEKTEPFLDRYGEASVQKTTASMLTLYYPHTQTQQWRHPYTHHQRNQFSSELLPPRKSTQYSRSFPSPKMQTRQSKSTGLEQEILVTTQLRYPLMDRAV